MSRRKFEPYELLAFVMMLMAMAFVIIFTCAGCRAPDRFDVGYGHQFQDVGSVKDLGLDTGDADTISFSVGWNLRPMQVEVIDRPERSWWPSWRPAESLETRVQAAKDAGEPLPEGVVGAVKTFDALDVVTKILLAVLAGWLAWVYRAKFLPKKRQTG